MALHRLSNADFPFRQKRNTTDKQARKVEPNTDAKDDSSDVKSFLDAHVSEPKTAAYVGYQDLAEYRKFLISHCFIPYHLAYAQDFAVKSGSKSPKTALELLRDLRQPDIDFPADFQIALDKYPVCSTIKTKGANKDQLQSKGS